MQAVILAAGRSTRTYPLTLTRPKPLLRIGKKTIIEHTLDSLKGIVDEAVIIIGYRKGQIKKFLGRRYKNIRLRYIEQKQQLGTAHALLMAEPVIKSNFLMLAGDDLYSRNDIRKCTQHRYSILTAKVKNPENFGVVTENNGLLADFIEKPKRFVSDRVNTSLYCLDRKIFSLLREIKKSERNELEMPDAIKMLASKEKIYCVKSSSWFPIGYPWDLLYADMKLRKNKNIIKERAKIKGKVLNSSIGRNCTIKGMVKNSILTDNCRVDGTVQNSIFGEDVHFKGKIIAKNNVHVIISGRRILVKKIGAIIGDGSRLENVTVGAGVSIPPNSNIKNKRITNEL